MKLKNLILTYSVLLPILIAVRTYQVINYVDEETGFFKYQYREYATFSFVTLLIAVLLLSVFMIIVRRCPRKEPKVKPAVSVPSFATSIFCFVQVFNIPAVFLGNKIFFLIFALVCMLNSAFFAYYGLKAFMKIHLSKYIYLIPVAYWLLILISSYISISKMPVISENVLMIFATASTAIFMLYFSKIANFILTKYTYKIVLIISTFAVSCDLIYSVPTLIAIFINKQTVIHNSVYSLLVYCFTGIFILFYTLRFFSNGNLSRHHHHSGSERILEHETINQELPQTEENNN